MQLPKIFETRGLVQHTKCVWLAAFARSVVHYCDARLQAMHERRGSRFRQPVMRSQIEIHHTDSVRGAHQIEFTVPCEVAQIDGSKATVSENESGRVAVVRIRVRALILLLHTCARSVRAAAAGKIRSNELVGRCHGGDIEAVHLHFVARLHDGALSLGQLLIRRDKSCRHDPIISMRFTVIVKVHDRNLPGEGEQRSDVMITIDPTTNRMYVADGYGNRRVVIVDAASGKYIGHFGAYGNNPVDDKGAAAAGPWMNDFTKGNMKPAFFRNPVHCVKISKEGLLYVCDRGNNRIQVFNGRDANLGKECANGTGEAGKCGFVKEQQVAVKTNGLPGSAVSMSFSTDAKQSCLYVGDNSNMTIYVLNRDTLQELGRLGRSGRGAGEFHWLHQVSVDSQGNIYTAEVDTGKHIQKFVRYGSDGCSGTGRSTVGGVLK